jgi:isopenicillin N synthase-like dioxygenase
VLLTPSPEPLLDGSLQQPLPTSLIPHNTTLITFMNNCHALCLKILQNFAIALQIPENWFTKRHSSSTEASGTVFRMLYYPTRPESYGEGTDIRAGAHSDYGSITLLFQQPGQPGLEIKTPSGDWAPVAVDPHTESVGDFNAGVLEARLLPILVNIGDLLEDWTAGLLKSTVHRVVFPSSGNSGDRYSMAYFCHPLDHALLEPVPSDQVREHALQSGRRLARNGKLITARDHLMERLAATYTVDK